MVDVSRITAELVHKIPQMVNALRAILNGQPFFACERSSRKLFHSIEKLDTGMFSCPFSSTISSTRDRYLVELLADAQVFQQARASMRQARQGSCGWYCESETEVMPDRREPLLLLTNKGDVFVKQSHYCLFIHFFPQILIVLSLLPLAKV